MTGLASSSAAFGASCTCVSLASEARTLTDTLRSSSQRAIDALCACCVSGAATDWDGQAATLFRERIDALRQALAPLPDDLARIGSITWADAS